MSKTAASKPTDVRLVEVTTETETFAYRTPMKFGGRVVTDVVLLHVTAKVETRDGKLGEGLGSMPIGNGWPAKPWVRHLLWSRKRYHLSIPQYRAS